MSPIYDLLRSNGSIVVNKCFIHGIGLKEAITYSELLSKHDYFKNKGQLQGDGSFFNTIDDLFIDTGLGDRSQRTAIKNLVDLGLLATITRGIPPKRYFKINFKDEAVLHYLKIGADKIAMKREDMKVKNTVSLGKLKIPALAEIKGCDSR